MNNWAMLADLTVMGASGGPLLRAESIAGFAWSPTGGHFAYSTAPKAAGQRNQVRPGDLSGTHYIARSDGSIIKEIPGTAARSGLPPDFEAGNFAWSPDGKRLALVLASGRTGIYDLTLGDLEALPPEVDRVLAWVRGGRSLLVATQHNPDCYVVCFQAQLLDLADGRMERVPILDNGRTFWPAPDGAMAVTYTRAAEGAAFPIVVALLDFTTLILTPIPGSSVGYPSEYIPHEHLVFEPSGAGFVWADVGWTNAFVRANRDGSGLSRLSALPSIRVAFSPDIQKYAFVDYGTAQGVP
ncbi:MAG: hypothetical protein EXR51_02985 [Dehalococcoidia bacterium]|nr:hypothetical protein [Dehalococcoidia bacterium]